MFMIDKRYLNEVLQEFWEMHQNSIPPDTERYRQVSTEIAQALVESLAALNVVQQTCKNLQCEVQSLQEELFTDSKKTPAKAS
jgi:hypothetical protein